MTTIPPSVRRQEWGAIFTLSTLVFFITAALLFFKTWHLESSWGTWRDHWPYFWSALKDLLLEHNLSSWQHYWKIISKYNLQKTFFFHTAVVLAPASLLGGLVIWGLYTPGGLDGLRHIIGARLYWFSIAAKHAKKQLKKELREHPQKGLQLHPDVTITKTRESGNIFVAGAQGTGKTVFITPLIRQVLDRGERAFIYDEKREFTALFYKSSNSILIAPWDSRSAAWDISADAKSTAQAQLIAERLIPSSEDPLWSNGARMIFVGMVQILNTSGNPWGWRELAGTLSMNETELSEKITKHYPRAARFILENSKTTQSFFAQLIGSLGWIYTLSDAWPESYKNGFSISHWACQKRTGMQTIIVQADKRYKDIGAPLANALIALMTSNILAQANSKSRELWLFLDELANLPKNDSLMEWMSLGRSKGCRIVAGTQSISQLQQIYTERGADALLNMFTIFASMRLGTAGETAIQISKAFGERVVERPTSSAGPSGNPVQNWHRETLPLVTASDLVQLPQASKQGVEGYLLIPGWQAVYKLRWPIPKLSPQTKENLPAGWLTESPKSLGSENYDQPIFNRRARLKERRQSNAINERD